MKKKEEKGKNIEQLQSNKAYLLPLHQFAQFHVYYGLSILLFPGRPLYQFIRHRTDRRYREICLPIYSFS